MLIRPATNDDAEAIRRLVFSVLDEFGLRCSHEGVDADLDDIQANYFVVGGFFDVLLDDADQVVGSVGVFPKSSEICELRKMYLVSELRGRGFGRMLLDRVLSEARSRGFRRMELETSSRLTKAIALYDSYGFRRFESGEMSSRCDQRWQLSLL